jgi:predicted restriction endonuclease
MKDQIINGKIFREESNLSTVVPDCFVKRNKLVTEANKLKNRPSSGESRIYVSSQELMKSTNFFTFPNTVTYLKNTFNSATENLCYFSKENLLDYIHEAQTEYTEPTLNFFYDITVDFEAYKTAISNLSDFSFFTIFNHKGTKDSSRFYINSLNDIWTLFREVSLPQISYLNVYKLRSNDGNILYYFELKLNEKHVSKKKVEREQRIETEIINDTTITETERVSLVKSRNGQGKFRNNVISVMKRCPFTQISDRTLLRASHIKPWVDCLDNHERLDGYNGLALTPTYDVLFDRGLISFSNNGSLLVSSLLSDDINKSLHLKSGNIYDICNSTGKRDEYLKYHRSNVFKK